MNPEQFDPGPLADVEHRVGDDGRSTLVFVRRFRHSPAKVWAALTDPAQLAEWAPFDPDRDLAHPGPAVLSMSEGGQVEEYPVTVLTAVEPRLLEYTWDEDLLRWELEPDGAGTKLTLLHTCASPDWVLKAGAGWHICLEVADRYLSGAPIGRIVGSECKRYGWQELHDRYAAKLGLEGAR